MISQIKKFKGYLFPNKNPHSKAPYASKEEYLQIYNKCINRRHEHVEKKCKELGYILDKKFINELALITQVVIKKTEINFQHGNIIYAVLMKYISQMKIKNIVILETGTAKGFSSVCMSKAINESSIEGKIYSVDFLPHNKKMYWNCILDFEGKHSRSTLLDNWNKETRNIEFLEGKTKKILKKLDLPRVNFAFLDAAHTKKDVIYEFNYLQKRQVRGDIIIFDDVTKNLFPGVISALNIIKNMGTYNIEFFEIAKYRRIAIATKI